MSISVARANWAQNVRFQAEFFHVPATIADLQRIVANSSLVKAVGTGHSFSEIADTTGTQVSVAGLPRIIEVDTVRRIARVSAGLTYGAIGSELLRHGLALHNTGSLPHIGIAGAVSTGTHGSGNDLGNLASAVSELELVTAAGDLITVRRGDRDFEGMVVALGALGVITAVTLDLVPARLVRQDVYDAVPHEQVVDQIDEIMASADSVSVFGNWKQPLVHHIWRKSFTEDEAASAVWLGTVADRNRSPFGPGFAADNVTDQLGRPGPWPDRLFHFRQDFTPSFGDELQSEFLLPRGQAAAAIRSLEDLADRLAPVLLTTELRTVAADDLWLSTAQGRDSFAVHFTWIGDTERVLPVLREVEARLLPLGGRPHWGKVTTATAADIEPLYPHLADFRRLRQQFDPSGTFDNGWLRRLLGA